MLYETYEHWIDEMLNSVDEEYDNTINGFKRKISNTRKRIKSIENCLRDFEAKCNK